ncbi:predicted protein [Chaetomium globosum CBS 148.51]|uniref:Transcription factor domain-containing protein n=1 Tax=Chaetomium globosum (strain ATCC 6205 / CBS 148.51 / DSM 1962 / NBRC 6347 / NRRL 1970) TaxID=306901 RepID=Q2HC18_CHAGB|nr:uncharacterized protein CHGG_02236 [Chaetomium globosum CBS 148.51]EAQ90301.1 predicted protein [Chaetomium globosum CBS 148.51]
MSPARTGVGGGQPPHAVRLGLLRSLQHEGAILTCYLAEDRLSPSNTEPTAPSGRSSPASLAVPVPAVLPALPPSTFSSRSSSTPSTESNRILELELMHRWSTRSWTSAESTPVCRAYLVDHLPRAALRNGYLLNALLATAAVDLAVSHKTSDSLNDSASYFRTALEYGNKAMADFRAQVTALTPDNVDLVFYFSSLVGVVHFSVPPADKHVSIIDRVCEHAEVTLKSGHIVAENMAWILAGPSPLPTVLRDYTVDLALMDELDQKTRAALELMSAVSRLVRVAPTSPTVQGSAVITGEMPGMMQDGQRPLACEIHVYQLAIGQTKYCYAEDLRDRRKAYFHTMFAVAGAPFSAAVRNREPMALFILMYWGVLVHRGKRDPSLWVLVPEGRNIVAESSSLVLFSEIVDVPGVREGIAWTRFQVGLPELPGCVLPSTLLETEIVAGVYTDAMEAAAGGMETGQ